MPNSSMPETNQPITPPQISVVFMGTPEFAATALQSLIQEAYHIVGVVTQPDRKTGRAQTLTPSPVKALAEKSGLPILQPEKLDETAIQTMRDWKPDVIVVAAYGKILPEAVLSLPGFGCINIHGSILPRWRGASPVANALMAGDTETGITLIQLDRGMDTGPIIATRPTPIAENERADALLGRLATIGAELLVETLPLWIERKISATPQEEEGATVCQLIEREDGRIFWNTSAEEIYQRYRGLYPWPGIFTFWKRGADDTVRIKLHAIELQRTAPATDHPAGTVIEIGEKVGVQTGAGVIFLETVQMEGKESLSIRDFLKGSPEFIGALLV